MGERATGERVTGERATGEEAMGEEAKRGNMSIVTAAKMPIFLSGGDPHLYVV